VPEKTNVVHLHEDGKDERVRRDKHRDHGCEQQKLAAGELCDRQRVASWQADDQDNNDRNTAVDDRLSHPDHHETVVEPE
jgi:hypothetical protein